MPENVLNNTTNAAFIPTIVAQKAIQRLKSYLNLARTVSKYSDWAAGSQGQVLQIPKTGAVVANDKTAGNNYTKQNPTATSVSVTLNKQKEATVTIDDVTTVLQNQDVQDRYANDAAIAVAEAIETDLLALHTSMQNTVTWNRTSATTIDASMLAIRKFFTDQKVPKLETRYFYVDATVYNDLLGTDKFSRYDARGDGKSIEDGAVIRTYGMEVHESQLVPVTGSPVAYHNVAYTANGIVLATRPLPRPQGFGGNYAVINDPDLGVSLRTLFWYNADLGAHQLTIDVLYGVAVIDQRRVLEVESF